MSSMISLLKKIIAVVIVTLCISGISFTVSAESYISYTYDAYGEEVPAPVAYRTVGVLKDELYDGKSLNAPEDCFVAQDGKTYICDTGNNRIVVLNEDFSLFKTVEGFTVAGGEPQFFKNPKGIFVTRDGDIYLCDTGNARILIADSNFEQKKSPLLKPKSKLISDKTQFVPNKVAVDTAGNVYVVAFGIYQGLVSYNPNGEFIGFYGSNPVELKLSQRMLIFWKELFTDEQENVMEQFIPVEFTNLCVDKDNCVYTVTQQTESSQDEIKKLNALGNNVMRYDEENTLYPANDFGDHGTVIENNVQIDSRFEYIHVDFEGIITALDTRRGRVFQYDQDGNLLFIFGGIGQQEGIFAEPVAIEKLGTNYIVLDRVYGSVTVFEPTAYANTVREALNLYNKGEYHQAQSLWEDVLKVSNYSTLAYRGVGRCLLQRQKYSEALPYLKKAEDRIGYSEAFAEVRKEIIRNHLVIIVVATVVGITVVAKLLGIILRYFGVLEAKQKRKWRRNNDCG